MVQPFKVCPQCGTSAEMDASQCCQCGRQYRSTAPPMKPCPQCRNLLVHNAEMCPMCRYDFTAPFTSSRSFCSHCGEIAEQVAKFCKHCGASQNLPAFQPQHPGNYSDPFSCHSFNEKPAANVGLITTMWLLTGIAIGLVMTTGSDGFRLAILLDIPALIVAIVLACSKHGTDKANGWVKIGLEIIGVLIGFTSAFSRSGG